MMDGLTTIRLLLLSCAGLERGLRMSKLWRAKYPVEVVQRRKAMDL